MERPEALLRLRDDLIRWTAQTGDLALALLDQEAWDLFLVNLSATHSGGHKLWDTTTVRGELSSGDTDALTAALPQVYAACDATVGRLVDRVGPATVLVFSLHGMGPNTSRVLLLPEMLNRILTGGKEPSGRPGALQRLRSLVPNEWRPRSRASFRLECRID